MEILENTLEQTPVPKTDVEGAEEVRGARGVSRDTGTCLSYRV